MSMTLIVILYCLGIGLAFGLPAYLGVLLFRKYESNATSKLDSILMSYHYVGNKDNTHKVTFHTYHGFLIWFTQTKHVIQFDPSNIEPAINLLTALRNFTLKWGFFAYGARFIPILTYFEYNKAIKAVTRKREGNK